MKKILAIASYGGHWIQLMRLKPVFDQHDTVYISTHADAKSHIEHQHFSSVSEANANSPIKTGLCAIKIATIILRQRPDVIISTGAAPGFLCIFLGKLFGAQTIWIDSLANAETPSLSGLKARQWSDYWFLQWEDLALKHNALYLGQVI